MAFSRRLGVVGILGVSWLVAVGCGSDDGKKTAGADGGEAGEASGGKSAGGSTNTAGKAGATTAGKGGTGGATAGSGGSAGTAGTNANAGQAGAPEMTGGAAGDGSGTGGASGGAGGAGGAPPAGALACLNSCAVDGDCVLKSSNDTTFRCNSTTHRCEDRTATCQTQADCPAIFWTAGCTINDDCSAGEACVAFRGTGFCAPVPVDGCLPDIALTLPLVDGGAAQAVCGSGDSRCIAGACEIGCAFLPCSGPGEVCDEVSGLCGCETGPDCDSGVCTNGQCAPAGCVTSDDCAAKSARTGLDICVDGKCGCSGSAACVASSYVNAPAVCE